jgi:hypothetical protein
MEGGTISAFDEALNIMNAAIVRGERVRERIQTEPAHGRCWCCALFRECQEHINVDDTDICKQWREKE